MSVAVCAFYKFFELPEAQVQSAREQIAPWAEELGVRGLLVVAPEGINATIAGSEASCRSLIQRIGNWLEVSFDGLKWSNAPQFPFRRFKVDPRKDIIDVGVVPVPRAVDTTSMLDPREFHRRLLDRDTIVVDVRNQYEAAVGTFERAIVPPVERFSEFPEYVRTCDVDRNKEVLIFCTGGIRCEKALTIMQREGFKRVRQLQGGILSYLETFGDQGQFRGECFVFDDRVAVDHQLRPTERYRFCRRCGDPTDTMSACPVCSAAVPYCSSCRVAGRPCSRRCEQALPVESVPKL